jgi:hemin uptake protein HemP
MPGDTEATPPPQRTVVLTGGELLNGQREILIRHGGEHYRLRRTRLDNLILTK